MNSDNFTHEFHLSSCKFASLALNLFDAFRGLGHRYLLSSGMGLKGKEGGMLVGLRGKEGRG